MNAVIMLMNVKKNELKVNYKTSDYISIVNSLQSIDRLLFN